MAKFNITKKVDLSFVGDKWQGCYLEFSAITFGEARKYVNTNFKENTDKALDMVIQLLEDKFVGGEAVGMNNEKVVVDKEDLKDFPAEVIIKVVNVLVGDIGKNA